MCALGEMVQLWRLRVLAGRGVLWEGRAVDQSLESTSALGKGHAMQCSGRRGCAQVGVDQMKGD